MIQFRQKSFSEYDAMKSLYVELTKRGDKRLWPVIDTSALIPILKGNNVVIERFVISTSFMHKDRYRMYLKIGAKAKLPDEVRLPGSYYDKKLGNASINFNLGLFKERNNSDTLELEGGATIKMFGTPPDVSGNINTVGMDISVRVQKLLGEAIKYDKASRSLVLEFTSIDDAIKALNILPFGLNYKIYILA